MPRMQECRFFLAVLTLSLAGGCGEGLLNQTSSLGGAGAGTRGNIGVVVLNNTPYRAVMTLGSYDQVSESFAPDVKQFTPDGATTLDPNSNGGFLTFKCARVVSLGGARLISALSASDSNDLDPGALIDGIEFLSVNEADPDAEPVSRGKAAPFEVLLGVDFPCNALLTFKLEVDGGDPETFRVDYELIPSSSSR